MKKLSVTIFFALLAISGRCFKNRAFCKKASSIRIPGGSIFSFFNLRHIGHLPSLLMCKVSPVECIVSIQIEKFLDGEYFDPGALQPNLSAFSCSWNNTNALPGFNYYRIAAIMSNIDVLYYDIQSVRIKVT